MSSSVHPVTVPQGFRWQARHWIPVAAGLLGLLTAIKWQTLTLPAAFDASWALYPAASYLADNGFDYPGLLAEPTGAELGPNTNHTLSITVLLTALAIRMLGNGALPFMHIMMLALAVAAVMGAYRFFRFTQPARQAGVLAGLTGLIPVASAQMGLVYVDVPVWAATVWAAAFVIDRDRLPHASLMAVLAAASKASGVITAAALGIFVIANSRSIRRAAAVAGPGIAVASVHLVAGSANRSAPLASGVLEQWDRGLASLLAMPAVLALVVLAIGSLVLRPNPTDRSDVLAWIFSGAFIATYLAGPVIGVDVPLLSRHWIQVIPFLLYAAWRLIERYGRPIQLGFATALLVWSVGSANGRWHPSTDLNIEVFQERTSVVYDMIELRSEVIAAAELMELPTYTSLNTWFRAQNPDAGFVDDPLDWAPVSHLGGVDPAVPATLPDRFAVIVDSPGRTADDEAAFIRAIEDSLVFSVETSAITVGRYSSEIRVYSRS